MNVGDRVMVITDPDPIRSIGPGFIEDMDKYCGQIVTVDYFGSTRYRFKIKEDGGEFWWHPGFVIPVQQRTE